MSNLQGSKERGSRLPRLPGNRVCSDGWRRPALPAAHERAATALPEAAANEISEAMLALG
jgi:hypothetical protein